MLRKYLEVDFAYEEDRKQMDDPPVRLGANEMADAFRRLPGPLRAEFKKAITAIDFDLAIGVAGKIQGEDEVLADALASLINTYRFDTLQEVLESHGSAGVDQNT